MYALDALFGLPRNRAAGVSHRPALHGNLFFCNQDSVDEFVAETDDLKQSLLCMCTPISQGTVVPCI